MPALLTATANDILNRVAAETGHEQVSDPWASSRQEFVQMKALLNIAGEELSQHYPWAFLCKEHTFTTTTAVEYTLPTDFLYIINQSGWDRSNDRPLYGPLSSQDWARMAGQDLDESTWAVGFRINEGSFKVLPDPMTSGLVIAYEYVSRNWVLDSSTGNTYTDEITQGADTPQFDRTLLSRYLKVKFLEAKGFDSSKAQADLNQSFQLITSRESGAPILNAGGGRRGFVYLGHHSYPDTGYG
jgi:hypothetical protein